MNIYFAPDDKFSWRRETQRHFLGVLFNYLSPPVLISEKTLSDILSRTKQQRLIRKCNNFIEWHFAEDPNRKLSCFRNSENFNLADNLFFIAGRIDEKGKRSKKGFKLCQLSLFNPGLGVEFSSDKVNEINYKEKKIWLEIITFLGNEIDGRIDKIFWFNWTVNKVSRRRLSHHETRDLRFL